MNVKRDASEVIADAVMGGLLSKQVNRDELVAALRATLPTAEPADAGRDAVAEAGNDGSVVWLTVAPPKAGTKLYTRPPSEAAAGLTKTAIEDIMAKYLGRHSRLYLYIQNDIRTALASQQAVKP